MRAGVTGASMVCFRPTVPGLPPRIVTVRNGGCYSQHYRNGLVVTSEVDDDSTSPVGDTNSDGYLDRAEIDKAIDKIRKVLK